MIDYTCVCVLVAQSCWTLCDPMAYSPPGSSVHGTSQARILEWVAISFSRGSSPPRDQRRFPAVQADSLPSEPQGKLCDFIFITCQKRKRGNSLAIQWLGLCALIAEGLGLIPVSGNEIPQAMCHGQKTNKKTPKTNKQKN